MSIIVFYCCHPDAGYPREAPCSGTKVLQHQAALSTIPKETDLNRLPSLQVETKKKGRAQMFWGLPRGAQPPSLEAGPGGTFHPEGALLVLLGTSAQPSLISRRTAPQSAAPAYWPGQCRICSQLAPLDHLCNTNRTPRMGAS